MRSTLVHPPASKIFFLSRSHQRKFPTNTNELVWPTNTTIESFSLEFGKIRVFVARRTSVVSDKPCDRMYVKRKEKKIVQQNEIYKKEHNIQSQLNVSCRSTSCKGFNFVTKSFRVSRKPTFEKFKRYQAVLAECNTFFFSLLDCSTLKIRN